MGSAKIIFISVPEKRALSKLGKGIILYKYQKS